MTNAARRPDPKRAQLRKLHSQELSVRAIAERLGVSRSTVSRWAKEDGLAFDRARTAQAVAAHSIDLAAGRQRLAEKMLQRAEEALDDLDKPYLVYNFGGKDNTYEEHELKRAPIEVRRNALTMAGITFDKLTRIVEKDPDVSGAQSVVQSLEAGILAAAAVLRTPETETDTSAE
ncbi:helix-turn-helix domain-containing protein [Leucobacter luti]|uniref:helix-turn-helix domain-containing protein n=1 Tax=Leucobacter luti TaxID=340320 RepID=UPI001C692D5F|nr:DUF1804 family protein [Leucobacter luti]QYM76919.1 DUF1804 family protein [Leucobacter luti]